MENKLKVEYVDIDTIKPYKNNAKLHPKEQIEQIKKSIENFGMNDPIGIWNNEIVEGHGRILACKELGYKQIPVIKLDHLTDEERKSYIIAHNKLTMNTDFDIDILRTELENLKELDFDLELTGFNVDELDDIFQTEEEQEIVEDDFDIELPEEPKAKLGDIYQLGNHRLMCGDSTKIEDVAKLMNGVKVDMVFTDPPYGVSYEGGLNEKKKQQIKNDNVTGNNLYNFLLEVFTNAKKYTNDKSAFYVFYATKTTKEFINAFLDSGLKQRSIIAWYKKGGGFGDFMAQYMNAYEPCIYGSNGDSVNWYGASNEKTVWEINKEKVCDLHPTMKPIEVVSRAINNSSKKEDSVLDLFGGSGSTLIACEQLNRKCYMMELDPHYIDVIIQRWEQFTGKKAVLLNKGE